MGWLRRRWTSERGRAPIHASAPAHSAGEVGPAGTVERLIPRQSMAAQMSNVATPRTPAIGRSKNARKAPSDLIIEVMKFCSNISPSTRPRIAGAIGKPFSSMIQPSTPMTNITMMP